MGVVDIKNPKWEHTHVLDLYLTCSFFFLSPSVIVWKKEKGTESLTGEGRRPHFESRGSSRASALNCSDIINVGVADQQPRQGTAEDTVYSVFSVSHHHLPHFCSLWHLIFSNTASSFLFIN